MRSLIRELVDRIEKLEQGKATSGVASFNRRIKVGPGYIEFGTDNSITLTRADGSTVSL
jgi:hypothetical protein